MESCRVDNTHRHHAQRCQARQKEVLTASGLDKLREVIADIGRLSACWIRGNRVPLVHGMVAEQRAGVVALIKIETVLNPLLLHKFELPKNVGANHHKGNALLGFIGAGTGRWLAVRQAASQDPAPLVQLRRGIGIVTVRVIGGIQIVPCVYPPQMRAN